LAFSRTPDQTRKLPLRKVTAILRWQMLIDQVPYICERLELHYGRDGKWPRQGARPIGAGQDLNLRDTKLFNAQLAAVEAGVESSVKAAKLRHSQPLAAPLPQ
jgi:hypothetical protein